MPTKQYILIKYECNFFLNKNASYIFRRKLNVHKFINQFLENVTNTCNLHVLKC